MVTPQTRERGAQRPGAAASVRWPTRNGDGCARTEGGARAPSRMSQSPPTRPQATPPAAPDATSSSHERGIDLATLIITALASATAAYVCSKVWAPGTLASAAFTPVLVALVKEALRKPTQVVTTVVPVPAQRRRRRAAGPSAATRVADPAPGADMAPPAIVAVDPPAVTYHRNAGRRLHWRVAVLTGLLGFAIAAAIYTVPELLAGSAASGGGRTTLFGGSDRHVQRTTTIRTNTVVLPGKTVTRTAPATTTTTTPAATTTTAPPITTPPTVTAPPVTTTAAPTTTTPAPTTSTATTPTTTTPAP